MPVQPPKPQLPPLNALRAFESAARLNSFKAAGEELHVTPGAIAQHIKALEAWAAGELFTRNARGVELTPLGRAALPAFSAAFDLLGSAVHGLSASAAPDLVRIAALPSIAQLWVSPRLPAIRKEMPLLQISLTAVDGRPNFNREIFDLQLFFEPEGAVLETGTVKLAEDFILPVCAPLIARQIRSVADLEHTPVLKDAQWSGDWARWANGVAPDITLKGTSSVFSLYSLAVDEAKSGGGVLMGHEPLVRRFLQDGSLVAPFPQRVSSGQTLVMRQKTNIAEREQVARVAALLRS